MPNHSLNFAPFSRWTLRDKAAQRRLALLYKISMKESAQIVLAGLFLIAIFFALGFLLLARFTEPYRISKKTFTLQQYVERYPSVKMGSGIKCIKCSSLSIKNWGLRGADDHRRIFICNHCNTRLYRSDGFWLFF